MQCMIVSIFLQVSQIPPQIALSLSQHFQGVQICCLFPNTCFLLVWGPIAAFNQYETKEALAMCLCQQGMTGLPLCHSCTLVTT